METREELRLECLRLAMQSQAQDISRRVVRDCARPQRSILEVAAEYVQFITAGDLPGRSD